MRFTTFLVATFAVSQAVFAQSERDIIREVSKELDELNRTDIALEEKKLQDELQELYKRDGERIQDVHARQQKLAALPEAKELARKRKELEEKRGNVWNLERKKLAEASEALYKQRHDELLRVTSPVAEVKGIAMDVLSYPRMDGSTSTHPLSVIIAARILGTGYEWTYPEPEGSPWGARPVGRPDAYLPGATPYVYGYRSSYDAEFTLAASRVIAKPSPREKERLAKMINSYLATSASTNQAYVRLIQDECDLNLTVRGPSADEQILAYEKNVEIALTPIAQDALVFMVSSKNQLDSLTREEIRKIFSGQIQNWSQLRLGGGQITPLWRERNSGSRELFDSAIRAKAPESEMKLIDPLKAGRGESLPRGKSLYAYGMSGPYNAIYGNASAIGYTVWYYDRYMSMSTQSRVIAVEGVEPARETIASGQYPLVTKIYAAYRKGEPADSPAMKLINWLLSPEGQSVIQEAGYVPLAKKP